MRMIFAINLSPLWSGRIKQFSRPHSNQLHVTCEYRLNLRVWGMVLIKIHKILCYAKGSTNIWSVNNNVSH